jgi:hypothetical protein
MPEAAHPSAAEICPTLPIPAPGAEQIHRALGYPRDAAPAPAMEKRIAGIAAEALPLLQPRGVYALYPVSSSTAHALQLDALTVSGNIGEYLRDAERVAVFVVTVGEEISRMAAAAGKHGDAFSAWVVDALGSWAAEAAAQALMLRLRPHLQPHQALTLRYSPGYCGMEMSQQRQLFRLAPAKAVGVTLLPSLLMHPLKSISGLVGLAPESAIQQYRSPCDLCPRFGCPMRR